MELLVASFCWFCCFGVYLPCALAVAFFFFFFLKKKKKKKLVSDLFICKNWVLILYEQIIEFLRRYILLPNSPGIAYNSCLIDWSCLLNFAIYTIMNYERERERERETSWFASLVRSVGLDGMNFSKKCNFTKATIYLLSDDK